MTTTLTIPTTPTTKSGPALMVSDLLERVYTAQPAEARTPFFVPVGQDYYWTAEWQRGEAEALREITTGNIRRFVSGEAAVRWLLTDDE